MSGNQYSQYCRKFGVKNSIKPSTGRNVRGIGGSRSSVGKATSQIPFMDLDVIVDIFFLLFEGHVPSFLCTKDLCKTAWKLLF